MAFCGGPPQDPVASRRRNDDAPQSLAGSGRVSGHGALHPAADGRDGADPGATSHQPNSAHQAPGVRKPPTPWRPTSHRYSLAGAPLSNGDAEHRAAIQRGRDLFFSERTGCARCHPPPYYTDSRLTSDPWRVHDVGTGGGAEEVAGAAFDTPSLLGLYAAASYLHDGRAKSLAEVLTTHNPADRHGATSHLSEAQIEDLVAFLLSLPAGKESHSEEVSRKVTGVDPESLQRRQHSPRFSHQNVRCLRRKAGSIDLISSFFAQVLRRKIATVRYCRSENGQPSCSTAVAIEQTHEDVFSTAAERFADSAEPRRFAR